MRIGFTKEKKKIRLHLRRNSRGSGLKTRRYSGMYVNRKVLAVLPAPFSSSDRAASIQALKMSG